MYEHKTFAEIPGIGEVDLVIKYQVHSDGIGAFEAAGYSGFDVGTYSPEIEKVRVFMDTPFTPEKIQHIQEWIDTNMDAPENDLKENCDWENPETE